MRIIPFILYLFLIAMHEVISSDLTTVYTAVINLPALAVLLVATYKSEVVSIWFGFAAGVVIAAGMPDLMGWHALILSVLGLTAFHVRERLNLDSLYAKLLLILGGVLVHNVLVLIVTRSDEFLYLLWSRALVGGILTSLVAWFFFLIKEGHITYAKMKALF